MKAKVALIIYKIGVKLLNRFFEYTNKVSYEILCYLVLVLIIIICIVLSGISFEELKIRIRKCDMPFSKGI